MTVTRFEHRNLDVACELDKAEARAQLEEWEQLRREYGLGAEPIPGGARILLHADGRRTAEALARRESACCGFLDLAISTPGDRVQLDITSPAAEAAPVIACLAGLDTPELPCC